MFFAKKKEVEKKRFFGPASKASIAVTVTITVLSVLLVAVSVLAFNMYLSLSRNDSFYNALNKAVEQSSEDTEEAELSPSDILEELDALFEKYYVGDIDEETLRETLIYSYIVTCGDDYAYYYTEEEYDALMEKMGGTSYGIGLLAVYTDNGLYVERTFKDAPADKAGLEAGDLITAVGEVNIVGMVLSDATALIKGESGTEVTLTVKRGESTLTITAVRGSYEFDSVELSYEEKNGKKIAVLTIDQFYEKTDEEFEEKIEEAITAGCDGFVFDLRGNPGGYLNTALNMLDYLLPEGPMVHLVFKDENKNITYTSNASYATDLPIVVLVNENSASAAELFTSALMDYEIATVVGTQTYGKGCGQNFYSLSNGDVVKLTSFLYTPPYSDNYDGVGITPDVVVELPESAQTKSIYILTDEEDTQMQMALSILTEESK